MRLCSLLILLALASPAMADSLKLHTVLPQGRSAVWSLAFSPDGKTLAVGSPACIFLWETTTWKLRGTLEHPASSLTFSQNGRILAAAALNHSEVAVCRMSTGGVFTFMGDGRDIHALALAPDGKTVAVSKGDWLDVFDVSVQRVIGKWSAFRAQVTALAFFRNGESLAVGHVHGDISFWDVRTGKRRVMFKGDDGHVNSLAFSADGSKLASAGRKIVLWAVETGRKLQSIDVRDPNFRIALSGDGTRVAAAAMDENGRVWDATQGKELATLGQNAPGLAIAFSPDGKLLAVSCPEGIKVWKLPHGGR